MPAIAALQQTKQGAPVPYFYGSQWADAPNAQGIEGKKVVAKREEIYRHWNERAEVLLMPCEEVGEFAYEHVPAKRVFYVKTRYVYLGKGHPQKFDLADE